MEKVYLNSSDGGLEISEKMLEQYMELLSSQGKSEVTIDVYRRNLTRLCQFLPENKKINRNTLDTFRKDMLANGYAASTVNSFTVSVNGFLEFCGCRDYQVFDTLKCEHDLKPEITRTEYLSLLSAARLRGRERLYLLVKVIASTGVMLSQLPEITIEAVRSGEVCLAGNTVHIPSALCGELLSYAGRHAIQTGSIFVTRTGHRMNRSNINREIRNLALEANILPEKCTPLSLRRMYQRSQENIRSMIEHLVKEAEDQMMEREQSRYGWEQLE